MRCLAQPLQGGTTQRKHFSTKHALTANRLHNPRLLIQAPCTSAFAPYLPFSPDLMRVTHAHPLKPAALAFVPFVIVLVRVRVRSILRAELSGLYYGLETIAMATGAACLLAEIIVVRSKHGNTTTTPAKQRHKRISVHAQALFVREKPCSYLTKKPGQTNTSDDEIGCVRESDHTCTQFNTEHLIISI
jgi:hypothetical protein